MYFSVFLTDRNEVCYMEKFLKKISESQELAPEDRLSAIIDKYASDELSFDELDSIYAARKADFRDFLENAGLSEDEK